MLRMLGTPFLVHCQPVWHLLCHAEVLLGLRDANRHRRGRETPDLRSAATLLHLDIWMRRPGTMLKKPRADSLFSRVDLPETASYAAKSVSFVPGFQLRRRSHTMRSTLFLSVICGVLLSSALGQEPRVFISPRPTSIHPETGASSTNPNLRIDSNLVLVPVTVTDPEDRLITDLNQERFRIYDDNVEQQIQHFTLEDAPVSVVFVFDASGSMREKLPKARQAVSEFARVSNPEDEFALIVFNNQARVQVGFTQESGDIVNGLTFVQAQGRTALLDAVCLALNQVRHARHARKAIVILSDGGDNSSRYRETEVKKRLREADAQIYSVAIVNPIAGHVIMPDEFSGPLLLNSLATRSGGMFFEVDGGDALAGVATKIGNALRNQYVLAYSPSTVQRDGKYHRITVKLDNAKGTLKLKATFRSSYLAPGQ